MPKKPPYLDTFNAKIFFIYKERFLSPFDAIETAHTFLFAKKIFSDLLERHAELLQKRPKNKLKLFILHQTNTGSLQYFFVVPTAVVVGSQQASLRT